MELMYLLWLKERERELSLSVTHSPVLKRGIFFSHTHTHTHTQKHTHMMMTLHF